MSWRNPELPWLVRVGLFVAVVGLYYVLLTYTIVGGTYALNWLLKGLQ